MKRLFIMACLAILPATYVAAEGYQVNAISTKQSGMGHVGTALKLGEESIHFNPAGLVYMKQNVQISAGVCGIFSDIKYKSLTDEYTFKDDNKTKTPFYMYAGFKIYDNLAAGISVNTPYGSGMNWGHDWRGAHLIQSIDLAAFNIQPTVSWKIIDGLSIGAGLMMDFGKISLNRALIGPGSLSNVADRIIGDNPIIGALIPEEIKQGIAMYDNVSAASVGLRGNAGVRVGFNVGAMYDINEKFTVGVSYRSKINVGVNEGSVKLDYANEMEFKKLLDNINNLVGMLPPGTVNIPGGSLQVPNLDKGTFEAELPLPDNWTVGLTYRPTNRWVISGEVQCVGWSAYDKLTVHFHPKEELGQYDIDAPKKYKNTRIYRLGTQFATTDRLDIRMGCYFDQSPVRDNYLNPETPSTDKLGITTGISFRPTKRVSVDVALSYVTGFGRDGSYTDTDLTGQPRTFGGHYNARAFLPSIGLSYCY